MIPYLEIDNAADRATKNEVSNRVVPVHPELMRLGFADYVRSQPPEGRLFPLLRADVFGHWSSGFSKWFNGVFLRKELGIADKRKVNHSFRHTFISLCRNSGIDIRAEYALTGHRLGAVHEGYGDAPSIEYLYSELKKVRFDGFPS